MLPSTNAVDPKSKHEEEDDTLTAEEIWPIVTSGPNKGRIKPTRDTHGNIVVDPAGNILKEQYLLDFNIYRELHAIN